MKRHLGVSLVAIPFVSLVCAVGLLAQAAQPTKAPAPKPAAKTVLPAAIDAAFRRAYPGATVKGVNREREAGVVVYEVESVDAGKGRDLIYRPDGTVVEMEEEMAMADMPGAVEAAVAKRYPKATVTKREKLTKGTAVSYELQLKGAGVAEATLSADGRWISPKSGQK